jgi:hypothetical protein
MKRKILCLFLAVLITLSLCGCGETAGQIADSVLDAAVAELKNQVKSLLEQNKLEVVEIKTAFGKLNDDGGKFQFFIAALVKANSAGGAQAAANAMDKLFTDAGLTAQTASEFENGYLVHKDITFKQTDFSAGGYYVIWGYAADLSISLPDLSGLIESTLGK